MKIIVDTNVLVRVLVRDDPDQTARAEAELAAADVIVIPPTVLVELVWVLTRSYRRSPGSVAAALRDLTNAAGVRTDRSALRAGLATLLDGGDFADGVIAHQGRMLGGEEFVSFDRVAVRSITQTGHAARHPA